MFAGLLLTSISAAMMRTALFGRKAKSGWLEELDGIREEALDRPEGQLPDLMGGTDDIWTDLRDGGEYEDPHEISSLYATDETPDQPSPKAKAKAKGRPKAKEAHPEPAPAAPAPVAALDAAPVAGSTEVPRLAPPVHHDAGIHHDADAPTGPIPLAEGEPMWVEPAPHPVRPSEMWHPADVAPQLGDAPAAGSTPAAEVPADLPAEERLAAYQATDAGAVHPSPGVGRAPSPLGDRSPLGDVPDDARELAAALESELVANADVAVYDESPTGLVAAPVGRRVRRDRPESRRRNALPTVDGGEPGAPDPIDRQAPAGPSGDRLDDLDDGGIGGLPPLPTRGETSPLPTEPLPPAALPTRPGPAARGPFGEPPAPAALDPRPGTAEPEPVAVEPEPELVAVEPQPVVVEPVAVTPEPEPEAVAPAPAPAPEPERAVVEPAGVRPLAIAEDGMVPVANTIVRTGGQHRGAATEGPSGPTIAVDQGWCWVSPGDGTPPALTLGLPTGFLRVASGATVLAVVDADRSAFVIVADGAADLRCGAEHQLLERGTIAMVDAEGAVQLDAASTSEIEADPVVAENLALDAEL